MVGRTRDAGLGITLGLGLGLGLRARAQVHATQPERGLSAALHRREPPREARDRKHSVICSTSSRLGHPQAGSPPAPNRVRLRGSDNDSSDSSRRATTVRFLAVRLLTPTLRVVENAGLFASTFRSGSRQFCAPNKLCTSHSRVVEPRVDLLVAVYKYYS